MLISLPLGQTWRNASFSHFVACVCSHSDSGTCSCRFSISRVAGYMRWRMSRQHSCWMSGRKGLRTSSPPGPRNIGTRFLSSVTGQFESMSINSNSTLTTGRQGASWQSSKMCSLLCTSGARLGWQLTCTSISGSRSHCMHLKSKQAALELVARQSLALEELLAYQVSAVLALNFYQLLAVVFHTWPVSQSEACSLSLSLTLRIISPCRMPTL